MKKKFGNDHKELSVEVATQKALVSAAEYEKLELSLRLVMIKVEAAEQRARDCINRRWWIAQIIRANYRRLAFLKLRFLDTLKRLMWVSIESAYVSRIVFHIGIRLQLFEGKPDTKLVREWLKLYLGYAQLHQATLDASQEAITMDEINRLERDISSTMENDSLLMELMMGIEAVSCYMAEKVELEQKSITSEKGTEAAVRYNQNLYFMKVKMQQLNGSVIDTVKVGLQGKLSTEDEYHTNLVGFPNDTPELPISEMKTIEAVLLEPFHPTVHIKLEQFLDVYLLQPWQAAQAVDDVRIEETIRTKEISMDRLQVELKGCKARIREDEEAIKDILEEEKGILATAGAFENLVEIDGDNAEDPEIGGKDEIVAHIEGLYKVCFEVVVYCTNSLNHVRSIMFALLGYFSVVMGCKFCCIRVFIYVYIDY